MYYLLLLLTYGLSLLPFPVLYLVSDILYGILFHVLRYRREVVMDNLRRSFPALSPEELQAVMKRFYRQLTDMMVETLKLLSISERSLRRRFHADTAVLEELLAQGRPCQLLLGHRFNWEWANLWLGLQLRQPVLVTYMPLRNRAMDRLLMRIRSRFGCVMIPANDVVRAMEPWQGRPYVSVLVADQNPGKRRRADWVPFLHRMTAFYRGPELSARRRDLAVVYGDIRRTRRGHYRATLRLAHAHPLQEPPGSLTRGFAAFLEMQIREDPPNWLWSHRRWKHVWNEADRGSPPPAP